MAPRASLLLRGSVSNEPCPAQPREQFKRKEGINGQEKMGKAYEFLPRSVDVHIR